MQRLMGAFIVVLAGAFIGSSSPAQEKEEKEETLKGKITCAKCELKLKGFTKCATVFVVKKGKKDVVYFFDKEGDKKYHGDICAEGKTGSVTGVFTKKDKKNIVKVKSVSYD